MAGNYVVTFRRTTDPNACIILPIKIHTIYRYVYFVLLNSIEAAYFYLDFLENVYTMHHENRFPGFCFIITQTVFLLRKERETLFVCVLRREKSEQEQPAQFKWYWKRTFLSHLFTSYLDTVTRQNFCCCFRFLFQEICLVRFMEIPFSTFHCILWIDWEFYIHECKSNWKCGLVVNRWK